MVRFEITEKKIKQNSSTGAFHNFKNWINKTTLLNFYWPFSKQKKQTKLFSDLSKLVRPNGRRRLATWCFWSRRSPSAAIPSSSRHPPPRHQPSSSRWRTSKCRSRKIMVRHFYLLTVVAHHYNIKRWILDCIQVENWKQTDDFIQLKGFAESLGEKLKRFCLRLKWGVLLICCL